MTVDIVISSANSNTIFIINYDFSSDIINLPSVVDNHQYHLSTIVIISQGKYHKIHEMATTYLTADIVTLFTTSEITKLLCLSL